MENGSTQPCQSRTSLPSSDNLLEKYNHSTNQSVNKSFDQTYNQSIKLLMEIIPIFNSLHQNAFEKDYL